ncbi:hypothetical protein SSYRP_v1c05410 [Spiroplasma syrphidicola EA-1]|uniref:Uncharacterized protein n=1 Tax=Spiroplasma syrphidicola EA-1 TaxID=1276229 RepID=R4ULQ2_9MOLU|nr:YwaF family protein [Spiroplasma syrphidicola]AGM26131.1 hypothetical protein SSYRP_v1c05410 [Spiroplasma syrphidicola EA-1]
MIIFSWILAIFLSIFLVLSLWIFPQFYLKTTKFLYLRIGLAIWLLIVEIDQFWYMLHGDGWKHFANYFTLYSCTIVAWVALIMLIYPNRIFLECFFPLGVMGPILTLIFPSRQPTILEWDFYVFYFGHTMTLFAFLYLYLFGVTNYHFSRQSIQHSFITGIIIILAVELFNQYFNTNYIVGDIAWAIGLKELARPWQFLISFILGIPIIGLGLMITYFFKPIYQYQTHEKLHLTWWEILVKQLKKNNHNKKIN